MKFHLKFHDEFQFMEKILPIEDKINKSRLLNITVNSDHGYPKEHRTIKSFGYHVQLLFICRFLLKISVHRR